MEKLTHLQAIVDAHTANIWQLNSRVHRLMNFKGLHTDVFIKREDESGLGFGGTKYRKYSALIPFLKKNLVESVCLIGGAYSNNLALLSQILIENAITPLLFLRGEPRLAIKGNHLILRMLVPEEQIYWIARKDWQQVTAIVQAHITRAKAEGKRIWSIPEGAAITPVLPGSMSLFLDIIRNERETDKIFSHILMDAGTGITAIACILCNTYLQMPRKIHVLLTAGTEKSFMQTLNHFHAAFSELLKHPCPQPEKFKVYPSNAFGKVTTEVLTEGISIARTEGILADPVYSVKLIKQAHQIIQEEKLSGNILIIHAGGTPSIFGFDDKIARLI